MTRPSATRAPGPRAHAAPGVAIRATGSALPPRRLTNADLEKVMDTSDEWIVQRTGINERRIADLPGGQTSATLAQAALGAALADGNLAPTDLDLIITATMTADMPTPGVSCLVAAALGCGNIGAFDINGACSGFVFSLNVVHEMIRSGRYRRIALIGSDTITRHVDYSTFGRSAAILFGDAACAFVLEASDNPSLGLIAECMHSDGNGAKHLFIPCARRDFHDPADYDERKMNRVQMAGQAVFKFAVLKFPEVIQETLDLAGLKADDVDHYVCHQANARILEAARHRFGLDPQRLTVNIDRYGNTVAASAPLVFDELKRAGRIHPGQRVMFIAFGAGLTWGSSLWQL